MRYEVGCHDLVGRLFHRRLAPGPCQRTVLMSHHTLLYPETSCIFCHRPLHNYLPCADDVPFCVRVGGALARSGTTNNGPCTPTDGFHC